eukprot:TRINITY_DN4333_c0_g1_i1.p1 TRINITY_DN4333_c0_g1~~TRINITY_DN4333_c0_g1_i1.p1  ORF type:complete len:269 (+),score=22.86 TRINITY_DN4333_c0_g1_i1:187-993(+)
MASASRLSRLTCVHNHINNTPEALSSLDTLKTGKLWLMGTERSDWSEVDEIHLRYPQRVLPCFGVHPWAASSSLSNDVEQLWETLEALLTKHPISLVGEIGIDGHAYDLKSRLKYPMDAQIEIFTKQLQIASRLKRPVSVHVVRSHGKFVDILRSLPESSLPPTFMMHSWTGSPEVAQVLLKMKDVGGRFYFSMSSLVSARSPKFADRLKVIPDDRILLESDVHSLLEVDGAMESILNTVAEVKGWTLDEAVARIEQNTDDFWSFPSI